MRIKKTHIFKKTKKIERRDLLVDFENNIKIYDNLPRNHQFLSGFLIFLKNINSEDE